MIPDDLPERDRIAVPDTRPNMFLFIPNGLAVGFGIAFAAINTQTHSLVNGLIVLPLWLIAAALVRRDVNGVRVFMVRVRLVLLVLDAHRWDGLSTSPWPLKEKRRA